MSLDATTCVSGAYCQVDRYGVAPINVVQIAFWSASTPLENSDFCTFGAIYMAQNPWIVTLKVQTKCYSLS